MSSSTPMPGGHVIRETVYAVVDTSGGPTPCDQFTLFFGNLTDAVTYLDASKDAHLRVYRMEPLPESAHWEWAVDSGTGPMEYVNERAARACAGSGRLLRRRLGSRVWEAVPADA